MRKPIKLLSAARSKPHDYLEYGAMLVLFASFVIQVTGSLSAGYGLISRSSPGIEETSMATNLVQPTRPLITQPATSSPAALPAKIESSPYWKSYQPLKWNWR